MWSNSEIYFSGKSSVSTSNVSNLSRSLLPYVLLACAIMLSELSVPSSNIIIELNSWWFLYWYIAICSLLNVLVSYLLSWNLGRELVGEYLSLYPRNRSQFPYIFQTCSWNHLRTLRSQAMNFSFATFYTDSAYFQQNSTIC